MSNVKRSIVAAFALAVGLAVLGILPAVAANAADSSTAGSATATGTAVQPDHVRTQP